LFAVSAAAGVAAAVLPSDITLCGLRSEDWYRRAKVQLATFSFQKVCADPSTKSYLFGTPYLMV
jgi:hypothetical protein